MAVSNLSPKIDKDILQQSAKLWVGFDRRTKNLIVKGAMACFVREGVWLDPTQEAKPCRDVLVTKMNDLPAFEGFETSLGDLLLYVAIEAGYVSKSCIEASA